MDAGRAREVSAFATRCKRNPGWMSSLSHIRGRLRSTGVKWRRLTPIAKHVDAVRRKAASMLSPSQGAEQRRKPPRDQDRSLSKAARLWVRSLPTRLRPMALCSSYARLANRMAAVWDDPIQTEALFDELLIDHRGGRHGFPPLVAAELMRLRHFHDRRLDPASRFDG